MTLAEAPHRLALAMLAAKAAAVPGGGPGSPRWQARYRPGGSSFPATASHAPTLSLRCRLETWLAAADMLLLLPSSAENFWLVLVETRRRCARDRAAAHRRAGTPAPGGRTRGAPAAMRVGRGDRGDCGGATGS